MASDYTKPLENNDDIFIRNVMAGVQGFFDGKVYLNQKSRDGIVEKVNVPFYTSYVGDEQFLMDYYYNPDPKTCERKVTGTTNTIPSGVFSLSNVGIPNQDIMNKYERSLFTKTFDTDYGNEVRQMSARTFWIPTLFEFNGIVKTSSDGMKYKIWQSLVRSLYKVRKFYITFEGFSRIPCLISFPESYSMPKEFKFEYGDTDKRPTIEFPFEVMTYLPDPDPETERFRGNKIEQTVITYKLEGGFSRNEDLKYDE